MNADRITDAGHGELARLVARGRLPHRESLDPLVARGLARCEEDRRGRTTVAPTRRGVRRHRQVEELLR